MSETKQTLKLKGGTCVQVEGHDAYLAGDTDVETSPKDFEALRALSTTPLQEYPKALADGHVVNSAEEEAAWLNPPKPSADPLDDVEVEMDNTDFDAPNKSTKASKKK